MDNSPITLIILQNGAEIKRFNPPRHGYLSVGRDAECHLTLNDPKISRFHLTLVLQDNAIFVTDDGSTNKTFINNNAIEPYDLYPVVDGDEINLGQTTYSIWIAYPQAAVDNPTSAPSVSNQSQEHSSSSIQRMLEAKGTLTIGRGDDADVRLPSLQVSRKHALLEKRDNGYLITDLNSKNGTFINGERITSTRPLTERDRITIANFDFQLKAEKPQDVRNFGLAIVANNVKKVYPNGKVGLNMMSLRIPSKTFVALMGPSGCGKSTLLKGLNGSNPFSQGSVYIHGIKLDRLNFNQIKRNIGYVPQDNVLHEELSVNDSLYFAAKLRMAEDVSEDEIQQKMNEVLRDLNINNNKLRNSRVKELSGGQKKRVAIAIELLNDPTILFLDEPTSPLDPETIAGFLTCIRQLNKKGVTVVMVTHKPEDLDFVDKVLFLSGDGNMVFFDDKEQLMLYFKQQSEHYYLVAKNSSGSPSTDYEAYFKVNGITDIYKLFKRPDDDDQPEIAGLRREVATSLINEWLNRSHKSEVIPPKEDIKPRYENLMRQFFWLSRRYAKTKWNDKANLLFLLLQPVIIGFLIAFVYDKYQIGVIFLTAISAIWFGVNNAAREIVDETSIYMRERMLNMSISSYLASKIFVLSIIGLVQISLFLGIIFFRYSIWPGNADQIPAPRDFPIQVGYMFWIFLGATLVGLLLSSAFTRTEQVMTWAPIILIPQILLAGIVARIDTAPKDYISYLTLGRWGLEGMARVQDEATLKMKNPYEDLECKPPGAPDKIIKSIYHPQPEMEMKEDLPIVKEDGTIKKENTCVMTGEETMQPKGAIDALGFYEQDDAEEEKDDAEEEKTEENKAEDDNEGSDSTDESDTEEKKEDYSTPAFLNKTLMNLGVIGIMNLFFLFGIFLLLKRRDPL